MELNVLSTLSRVLDPSDPDPCKGCGHCCRYVTVQLKAPRSRIDYDEIRWFLLHQNVTVFIDDDGWYVEFHTACRHLDGHRCGIYPTRPQVCSDYQVESCERYGSGKPWLHHFADERAFLTYLRKHRPRAYVWVMNPRPDEPRQAAATAVRQRRAASRNGRPAAPTAPVAKPPRGHSRMIGTHLADGAPPPEQSSSSAPRRRARTT